MTEVFVVSDNILSPLGRTTAANFSRLKESVTAIRQHSDRSLAEEPFFASLFDQKQTDQLLAAAPRLSLFENLLIVSIGEALKGTRVDPASPDTLLILSSTKGNIGLLEQSRSIKGAAGSGSTHQDERLSLGRSARVVAENFGFREQPLVASNACISGLLGIITGLRLLRMGRYRNAVVAGADQITRFILSGFQSFQALSPRPCAPFDIDRDGLSLGEGAATVILSSDPAHNDRPTIKVLSGRTGNDANHISGPSRTGEELSYIIRQVLADAQLDPGDIDLISAHGTATAYNDEMEAKAISLAGLGQTPVNSLKGFYGHTLGAAGLIESVATFESMREDLILPTLGFRKPGVSRPIQVAGSLMQRPLHHCLKTASGFGGCNAAVLFSKTNA